MTISSLKTGRAAVSRAAGPYRPLCNRAARKQSQPTALPRAAAFWLVAGVLFLSLVAASAPAPLYGVSPGSVPVLGGHADRGLRDRCPCRSHHVAGVRVIVGLPGPPRQDHSRPGRQHRRMRVVPDGPGRRPAVRCPCAARHRRRRSDRGARSRADRPATGRPVSRLSSIPQLPSLAWPPARSAPVPLVQYGPRQRIWCGGCCSVPSPWPSPEYS